MTDIMWDYTRIRDMQQIRVCITLFLDSRQNIGIKWFLDTNLAPGASVSTSGVWISKEIDENVQEMLFKKEFQNLVKENIFGYDEIPHKYHSYAEDIMNKLANTQERHRSKKNLGSFKF